MPRAESVPVSPVYQDTVLDDVPAIRLLAVANGGPLTRNGAGAAVAVPVAPKPSAANAAVFELVTVRSVTVAAVQRDRTAADGRRGCGAADRIDLRQQRLDAVGDVELVAGRAGGHKRDRRAIDGDGVAGAKLVASESDGATPDNSVAPVIGAGGAASLLTALPAIVADGLKKLFEAAIADAATSEVSLSFLTDDVNAACRLAVVAVVSAPIRNEPAGGGFVVVAVNAIDSLVPSGKLKLNVTLSFSFGLTAPRSTVAAGGEPVGCVTVAPVSDERDRTKLQPE